jgi:hypothetical protein
MSANFVEHAAIFHYGNQVIAVRVGAVVPAYNVYGSFFSFVSRVHSGTNSIAVRGGGDRLDGSRRGHVSHS